MNKMIKIKILCLDEADELLSHGFFEKVKNIIKNNPGKSKIFLHVIIPGKSETIITLGDSYLASASGLFTTEIESTLGKNSVNLS